MARLNLTRGATDNAGVDQVSRPMQIALVAVVLLAGMWFTVLRPKPAAETAAPAAQQQPVAPGVKGLAGAVDSAKGAAATSDAANAKVQAATGGSSATASKPAATATSTTTKAAPSKPATTKASATTATTAKTPAKTKSAAPAKPAAAATTGDPSKALLSFLAQGKTVVLLFHSDGADDAAARKAVHRVALQDKKVVTAYADIDKVGSYEAITSGVQVLTAPTILVIGTDKKATALTGYVDAATIEQAVGDARRNAAKSKAK